MFSLSSARSLLSACRPSLSVPRSATSFNPLGLFVRFRGQLAPKRVKHLKRHKGRVPIPTGGSTKGTTLAFGDYGIRIRGQGARFSAKQLELAEEVIKRKLKIVKGAKVWMRVFPDVAVCVKGNETRMGKGKGSFEYWSTKVPTGRVVFEIGGAHIREELARDSLRLAGDKLPATYEFVTRKSLPRQGLTTIQPPPPAIVEPPPVEPVA